MTKKATAEKASDGERKPGTFVKGDNRINRKGRPKSADQLRVLAKTLGFEMAVEDNGDPIFFNGRPITIIERIMLDWATSKDSRKQMLFVQYGWGSPIEEVASPPPQSDGFDVSLPPDPNG
jgi:hypothetical protein